ATASAFFPFSKPRHFYAFHAGPRRYFADEHAGLYLGLEPYAELDDYHGTRYSRVGLPVTFGAVFQGRRLVTSLDLGIGPAKVLSGAYKHPDLMGITSM